ncbi:uncharacterized protein LOC124941496 [Impatiens glandulifera]|uniref:uncharacterized protein LOC124941496 n=1 Tax=Impatiens glandulifera TaxID=253017 RepID=UPI001FB0A1C5|nr:uncharacterized protein LOC124941496 [Impatiens glandulifera]XP_047337793.1 uncharacterized protein LOC124941496 [Impatiens glandulifera]
MAILLSLPLHTRPATSQKHHTESTSRQIISLPFGPNSISLYSKRNVLLSTASLCFFSLALNLSIPTASAEIAKPSKSLLSRIANTKNWFLFYGDGFSIRVPPEFEDVMEPEDFNVGLSLYGDKVKPKTFAARFASSDGSEVVSVVIRPSNQLKITFLEAKDILDLGSLKEAAKIFVPGDATLFSARTIKIKEDEGFRTYYYYEFGKREQHIAMVAAINSGKVIIAGATAPESRWDDDGLRLRSAAVSLTVL